MSNDNVFKKLKNGMMLSCDSATLLITKGEFEKLSLMDELRLKMHLASCKLCRRFEEQSAEMSQQIKNFSDTDSITLAHKLSDEQKNKLSQIIDNK